MDKFLRSNLVLRIVALVFACFLWLAVSTPSGNAVTSSTNGVVEKVSFSFPIRVQISGNVVLSSTSAEQAKVEVGETFDNLIKLPVKMQEVELVANAAGMGPGTHVLHISAIGMPADVKAYGITPDTVIVKLAQRTVATRAIHVMTTGVPAGGYVVGTLSTLPQTVEVSGASQAVDSVDEVVASVAVNGTKSNVTQEATLTPVNSEGEVLSAVTVSPATVTVTVPILASTNHVSLLPAVTGTPAPGLALANVTLSPNSVDVTGGAKSTLAQGLHVPIDVSGLRKSQNLNVTIPMLPGITEVLPNQVQADITLAPSAVKTLIHVPITWRNVPAGVTVALIAPQTVNLSVVGPASVVNALTSADVTAYVDASGILHDSTSVTMPIVVILPQYVNVAQLSANTAIVQRTSSVAK